MAIISRREFIRASTGTAAGLLLSDVAIAAPNDVRCIFLVLVGGPSQLDTWDPKPDAPANVRSPFRPISTATPGLCFTELFPRMAAMSNRIAVVRSMKHDAAPIHETGLLLTQTGKLAEPGIETPHFGAVASAADGRSRFAPANVLLPGPIGFMGVNISRGQSAGNLGEAHEPAVVSLDVDRDPARSRFGATPFGDDCLRAARLVERGTRFVTVNMFDTVYDNRTWDCHAAGGSLASDLDDYRTVGPTFDAAYSALLDDLTQRGLMDSTLVVATGEFGRTPMLNRQGGRDHWAGAWSMMFAGAGVRGGQAIGATDRIGSEPVETPVGPEHLAATIRQALGLPKLASPIPGLFG